MYDIFEKLKALCNNNESAPGPLEYIVAGLGNPGKEYENSRHNIGFMFIDNVLSKLCCVNKKTKFDSLLYECTICSKKILLLKPQTYMNLSGKAIKQAMDFYKIPKENLVIIFDDISLDVGKIRIRKKGSHGGHNGIKDIIASIGSSDFPRIKIGVGNKPNPNYDLKKFVLSKFSYEDKQKIDKSLEKAYNALELMLCSQYEKAMNLYN